MQQQETRHLRYNHTNMMQQKPVVDMSMYSELFPNYSIIKAGPADASSPPLSGMCSPCSSSSSPVSSTSAATISCCDSDSDRNTTPASSRSTPPQRAGAPPGRLQRMDLAELRHFPSELADPSRLLLVSCSDPSKAHLYACRDCTSGRTAPQYGSGNSCCSVWALSYHHRHAFCTGCGKPASASMPAKQFAELFMAAATAYLLQDAAADQHPRRSGSSNSNGWWVGADSSCSLRLLNGIGADACSSCCAASYSHQDYVSYEEKDNDNDDDEDQSCRSSSPNNVWAVNSVYSHAFCTRCGHTAEGGSLVSLLLAIRFGGKKLLSRRGTLCPSNSTRSGKSTHGRESNVSVPTRRPASFR